jgi:hypothetical protein
MKNLKMNTMFRPEDREVVILSYSVRPGDRQRSLT